MTKDQIKKYQDLIERADQKMDNLTFEGMEELYREFDKDEKRSIKLQKEFKRLAKEVETAIIELQVLDFLDEGHNNPNAQDVEYD